MYNKLFILKHCMTNHQVDINCNVNLKIWFISIIINNRSILFQAINNLSISRLKFYEYFFYFYENYCNNNFTKKSQVT